MLLDTLIFLGDLRGAAEEALRQGSPATAAWCLLEAGDTAGAMELLAGVDEPEALLLKGEVYLRQLRAPEAIQALEQAPSSPKRDTLLVLAYILKGHPELAFGVDSALAAEAWARFPALYSAETARKLSLLPGAGHFYVGEPLRGLWASALVGGTLGYMVYAGVKKRYLDRVLVWQFLFNRFYAGAGANAQAIAREKNRKALREWLGEFLGS